MSSPKPKHNRITNANDNKVKPVFCQTFCYAFALVILILPICQCNNIKHLPFSIIEIHPNDKIPKFDTIQVLQIDSCIAY